MKNKETYTQAEVQELLEKQKQELKEQTKEFIDKKSEEIWEAKAIRLAEEYRELTLEEKQFHQDKKQIEFYVAEWALPEGMNLWKMMICRQLWRELGLSFMQTMNGIAFVNWKPSVYGETYLSLIVKNWYKINVLEENEEKVEIELDWPNGKQKWSFTKKEAEKLWILNKGVWSKYPVRMMRYKAIRNAQNVLCPEILGWAYLFDEAKEIEEEQEKIVNEEKIEEKVEDLKDKYLNC